MRNSCLIVLFLKKSRSSHRRCRSSHRRCSVRKRVLKNFGKLLRKTAVLESFSYEVASLQPASFLKRDPNTSAFLWSLRKFLEQLLLLLLKMCSWNWEKLKFLKSFNFTLKNRLFVASISETSENVCFYFMIGFPWSLYLHTIFLWCGEK